jgi:hypothetical protein
MTRDGPRSLRSLRQNGKMRQSQYLHIALFIIRARCYPIRNDVPSEVEISKKGVIS